MSNGARDVMLVQAPVIGDGFSVLLHEICSCFGKTSFPHAALLTPMGRFENHGMQGICRQGIYPSRDGLLMRMLFEEFLGAVKALFVHSGGTHFGYLLRGYDGGFVIKGISHEG